MVWTCVGDGRWFPDKKVWRPVVKGMQRDSGKQKNIGRGDQTEMKQFLIIDNAILDKKKQRSRIRVKG